MKTGDFRRTCAWCALSSALFVALGGCPLAGDLPEQFDVSVSGTDKTTAAINSGPPVAANASWAVSRAPDLATGKAALQSSSSPGPYGGLLNGGALERPPVGEQMFVVDFGDNGQIIAIRDNRYFLQRIYGETIPVGVGWIPATILGMTYRSGSYGVQIGNRFGVLIIAQVQLGQVLVGRAFIYAWGTIEESDITGTFGYLLDFSEGIGKLLLDTGGDQYPIVATQLE